MNHFQAVAIRKVDETIQDVQGALDNPLGISLFASRTKRFCKKKLKKLQQMAVYLDDYLMTDCSSSHVFEKLAQKLEAGMPFQELAQELKTFRENIKSVLLENAAA